MGYIESKTKYHKTATSLLKKQKFMPLVAPVLGVTRLDWTAHWLDSMAFLKVDIDKKPFGAICRAPRADGVLGDRPCSSEEIVTFTFFVLVRICFEGILLIIFHQNILAQVGLLVSLAFLFSLPPTP